MKWINKAVRVLGSLQLSSLLSLTVVFYPDVCCLVVTVIAGAQGISLCLSDRTGR